MKTKQEKVAEFHKACNSNGGSLKLRRELITEEFCELIDEIIEIENDSPLADKAKAAKELADLLYVIYGTAEVLGIDADAAFEAVHWSNMTKRDPITDKVIKDERGKVLKGELYQPPDMSSALRSK
jgi:predicted HAD superfamily Cof-like phosphohydrolase